MWYNILIITHINLFISFLLLSYKALTNSKVSAIINSREKGADHETTI